jgi:hypothetical protein
MSDTDGTRVVECPPHPDFSMAYRMAEALQNHDLHVVDDEGNDVSLPDQIRVFMHPMRKYGPSYIALMEKEK